MNDALIQAAIGACVSMTKAIDSILEDDRMSPDIDVTELRHEIVGAYHSLADQLSIELGTDAKKLTRDLVTAEIEAARTVMHAMVRLPS